MKDKTTEAEIRELAEVLEKKLADWPAWKQEAAAAGLLTLRHGARCGCGECPSAAILQAFGSIMFTGLIFAGSLAIALFALYNIGLWVIS